MPASSNLSSLIQIRQKSSNYNPMEVLRELEKLSLLSNETAIAIGNFDGVHLGHQKILQFLVREAKKYNLLSFVLTFSPHPERILRKARIRQIQTLSQRLEEIEKFGVHSVCIVSFTEKFSNLSSQEFIQDIIIKRFKVRVIIVGENFRFGRNRKGDISLLKKSVSKLGLKIFSVPPVTKEGHIISSSLIRNLLEQGQIDKANTLLGRFYRIEGKVIKGKSRGKDIGFPTANIETANEIVPSGIFITTVGIDSEVFPSLTNIGYRPTFGQQEANIESYIIDFNQNLYGKKINVNFIKKIREEKKFKTAEELSNQIQKDLKTAKAYFRLT